MILLLILFVSKLRFLKSHIRNNKSCFSYYGMTLIVHSLMCEWGHMHILVREDTSWHKAFLFFFFLHYYQFFESFIQGVLNISTTRPIPHKTIPLPYPSTFVSFFSPIHQVQFVMPIYSFMCSLSLECVQYTKGNTLKENWFSLYQQPSVVSR